MQNRYYMKDEIPFSDFPVYTEKSAGKSKALGIIFFVFLIVIAVVGGLYFLGNSQKSATKKAPVVTQVPTIAVSPTATPTPVKALNRSELQISVLNGSGVAGAANSTAANLRSLGYTVTSTGNADAYTYTGITVKVKKGKSDFSDLLKKDITASSSGASVSVSVDDTIPNDAQVIVGK